MRLILITILTSCTFICFSQAKKSEIDKPFVLRVTTEMQSAILGEKRILNIYLPEGFNDTAKYAVVYLLDGAADEDFIHIVGLYQFNNFEWINGAPKSIIVGIVNTDRKRDFTYPTTVTGDLKRYPTTGKSDKFINFIEKNCNHSLRKNIKPILQKQLSDNL